MKYLLALLLSLLFFAFTYTSASTEFTLFDFVFITGLLAAVSFIEYLVARLFVRYPIVQNLILAFFVTFNIFCLNLIINKAYAYLPVYGKGLSLLLAIFIIHTFMNMMDESSRNAKVLTAILALATAGVLIQNLLIGAPVLKKTTEYGKTSADNIRIVNFKNKPNVYFISFDALIPKVLLSKLLGIETTPYHEVLDANFRQFRNFFADRVPTRNSLNSLLALDIGHFTKAYQNSTYGQFFSGQKPSPLFEIFKHNGYETTTFFRSGYFGWKKGPYVDNYEMDILGTRSGACEFINITGMKAFTFLGYCSLVKEKKFQSFFRGSVVASELNSIDYLIESMRKGLKKDVPQVFVAYLYTPGHTPMPFDKRDKEALEKYKKQYLSESGKKTAKYLNKIIDFIAKDDPTAILYLFGDHGLWLSRNDTFEKDGAFLIHDRFGVYGGIYPRDRCAESFDRPYNEEFMTIAQGTHMIIRCLSGGKNAFITLEDYYIQEFKAKVRTRYENYLYE